MIHPSDRVMVEEHLRNLDAEAAAAELCRVLQLDGDARELITWCITEAHDTALAKFRAEAEREADVPEEP